MTRQPNTTDDHRSADPLPPANQQELYGRRAPRDLDVHAGVGRDPDAGDGDGDGAEPGRGEDAAGRPSTARIGANTQ